MTVAATVRAEIIQDALAALETIVDRAELHAAPDGIQAAAVDASNVEMVDLSIGAGAFESYSGGGEVVGVNVWQLREMVDCANPSEFAHLAFGEEMLTIHIGDLEMGQPLIDHDKILKQPTSLDIDWPATVVLSGSDLGRCCTAAELTSGHVEVGADADGFRASTVSGDSYASLDLPAEELLGYPRRPKKPVSSRVTSDYLTDVQTAAPSDAAVTVWLGDEKPVKFQWSDHNGDLSVTFSISPRIETGGGR